MSKLPMSVMSQVDDASLTPSQFRVLAHICRRSWKKGKCWAAVKTMAEVCMINIKTVRSCINHLEKTGWIEVERKQGMTMKITPLTPPNPIPYPNEYPTQMNTQHPYQSDTGGSTQSDTPEGIEVSIKRSKQTGYSLPFNSELFTQTWNNWIIHRKQLKKPLTETSIKQQLKKLESLGEQTAIYWIETAIEKCWQGLYEPPNKNQNQPRPIDEKLTYQKNGNKLRPFD